MGLNQLLSFSSTMKSIGGVVLAVVILLVMVTIHEFGHYIAGKLLHFKIEEFSVGFGPALFKKRSKKTGELFALRVIPLGGYCAFDGEDDTDDADSPTPPPAEPFEDMSAKSVSERSESLRPRRTAALRTLPRPSVNRLPRLLLPSLPRRQIPALWMRVRLPYRTGVLHPRISRLRQIRLRLPQPLPRLPLPPFAPKAQFRVSLGIRGQKVQRPAALETHHRSDSGRDDELSAGAGDYHYYVHLRGAAAVCSHAEARRLGTGNVADGFRSDGYDAAVARATSIVSVEGKSMYPAHRLCRRPAR